MVFEEKKKPELHMINNENFKEIKIEPDYFIMKEDRDSIEALNKFRGEFELFNARLTSKFGIIPYTEDKEIPKELEERKKVLKEVETKLNFKLEELKNKLGDKFRLVNFEKYKDSLNRYLLEGSFDDRYQLEIARDSLNFCKETYDNPTILEDKFIWKVMNPIKDDLRKFEEDNNHGQKHRVWLSKDLKELLESLRFLNYNLDENRNELKEKIETIISELTKILSKHTNSEVFDKVKPMVDEIFNNIKSRRNLKPNLKIVK